MKWNLITPRSEKKRDVSLQASKFSLQIKVRDQVSAFQTKSYFLSTGVAYKAFCATSNECQVNLIQLRMRFQAVGRVEKNIWVIYYISVVCRY